MCTAIRARCGTPDGCIAELAALQQGIVALRQLLRLGLSSPAVQKRVARGSLHQLHAGVYAVGHLAITWRGRLMAASLAFGPGAYVSHRSAAALWGFLRMPEGARIDVLVARGRSRGRAGLALHRTRSLTGADCAEVDAIPVTSVARTLLDLSGALSGPRLLRAFEEADRLGLLDRAELYAVLARSNGHRGAKRLRRIAISHAMPVPSTRSHPEYRFFRLCEETGLTLPEVNATIAGIEVDCLWRERRLILELDGPQYHGSAWQVRRDEARDARLRRAGFRVERRGTARVYGEAPTLVAEVAALLA